MTNERYALNSDERNALVDKLRCKAIDKFEAQIDDCLTIDSVYQLVLALSDTFSRLSQIRGDF